MKFNIITHVSTNNIRSEELGLFTNLSGNYKYGQILKKLHN